MVLTTLVMEEIYLEIIMSALLILELKLVKEIKQTHFMQNYNQVMSLIQQQT